MNQKTEDRDGKRARETEIGDRWIFRRKDAAVM